MTDVEEIEIEGSRGVAHLVFRFPDTKKQAHVHLERVLKGVVGEHAREFNKLSRQLQYGLGKKWQKHAKEGWEHVVAHLDPLPVPQPLKEKLRFHWYPPQLVHRVEKRRNCCKGRLCVLPLRG